MKKDIVVLGLGNPLMSDEGIGGFLIERFLESDHLYPDADFIDAGTGGLSILHYLEDRKKAILIDCAMMDSEPGTIRKFYPDEVKSVKKLTHKSLHEADILKVIDFAKQLNQCPEEIVIFGIQPETIKQDQQLSATLLGLIDSYISTIAEELSV